MHVWLAEATARQRTLLVTRYDPFERKDKSSIVLVFSVSNGQCSLSLLHASDLDWSHMQRLSSPSLPLQGLLGMLKIGGDTYLGFVTYAERIGSLQHGHWVSRVRGVTFFCINRAVHDEDFHYGIDPQEYGRGVAGAAPSESPFSSIRKYMSSGFFFFAERGAFDLTRRVAILASQSDLDQQFASQFAWNAHMMDPILQFRSRLDASRRAMLDQEAFFLLVIQGYVGMASVPLGPSRHDKCIMAVISRLSTRKAGTRYNARGIDDQGAAANFAETETVLAFGNELMSFVQVRGSVPLFWEQQGLQAWNARIQITRTGAASQPAFEQHMQQLLDEYGRVFALDLLGTRDAETALSLEYVRHIEAMLPHLPWHGDQKPLRYYNFDFHSITKSSGGLDGTRAELNRLNNVQSQRQSNGFTLMRLDPDQTHPLEMQTGIFRVNCFDCLDRTNVVQGCLSHAAIRDFIRTVQHIPSKDESLSLLSQAPNLPEAFWPTHGRLWAENGDALSQISTGTGSLNSDYMRSGTKKLLSGLLSDAAKSASRMYMNNFQDQSKQQAIDTLLGTRSGQEHVQLYDPLYAAADSELARRYAEYATEQNVRLFVSTYNVSAQNAPNLDIWLGQARDVDVVAIVFQEIVPLTAQQMLSSAAEPMRLWEAAVLAALNRGGGQRFITLRYELLFATSVLIVVREDMLPHVRNVDAASKKTGLRGMSGNKGGVAVRMEVFETDVCIVGVHLAAGTTNVEERNNDYQSIVSGIQFPRGRTIESHTHVFWSGDLNYRFDQLNSAEVRQLCAELPATNYTGQATESSPALSRLYAYDQLKRAQACLAAFENYKEGPLLFRPTYKYDMHADTYDSSEKARAPAWTDRIVYRSTMDKTDAILLNAYGCVDLRISDHRPVFAIFDIRAYTINTQKRAALQQQVLAGLPLETESVPRPSDDTQQWWNVGPPLAPSTDPTPGNPFRPSRDLARAPSIGARPAPPPMPPRRKAGGQKDSASDAPETPAPAATDGAPASDHTHTGSEDGCAAPPPVPRRPDRI